MAKSYTNLEQSRKLAEILSPESADQIWERIAIVGANIDVPEEMQYWHSETAYILNSKIGIPCWSLAALLGFLDRTAYFIDEDASINLSSYKTIKWTVSIDNSDLKPITEADPIDACVKMILKLHELNLL